MVISIKGLTGSTIILNSLKITLRGETVLSNIIIDNDEQMREIIGLKNAKLLVYRTEPDKPKVEEQNIKINFENQSQSISQFSLPLEQPAITSQEAEEIEEAEKEEFIFKPKAKKIIKAVEQEPVEQNDEVTVMTLSGPKSGKMVRSITKDMPESEATRASIEAMKQLEAEEAGEDTEETQWDESSLPENERMGSPATIGAGKNSIQVNMRNSILPESEIAAKARAKSKNIKFINAVDDVPDSPFIDNDKSNKAPIAFIDKDNEVNPSYVDVDNVDNANEEGNEDTNDEKTGEY